MHDEFIVRNVARRATIHYNKQETHWRHMVLCLSSFRYIAFLISLRVITFYDCLYDPLFSPHSSLTPLPSSTSLSCVYFPAISDASFHSLPQTHPAMPPRR